MVACFFGFGDQGFTGFKWEVYKVEPDVEEPSEKVQIALGFTNPENTRFKEFLDKQRLLLIEKKFE